MVLFDRLGLSDARLGAVVNRLGGRFSGSLNTLANKFSNRFVDGTGVGFLLGDAELRQHFEDHMRGNLELPGQLVYANFAHIDSNALVTRRLTDFLRVLYGIKFGLGI